MGLPHALQSTEPQRLRQMEIERRIMPVKLTVGACLVIGLALLAIDASTADVLRTIALAAIYIPVQAFIDHRAPRSRAPLLWLAVEELGILLILAFAVTWSGGVHSPALPMTLMVAIIMGTRFPIPWLLVLVPVMVTFLGAAMAIADMALVRDAPVLALSWIAAFSLATALAAMLARAERGARRDAVHDALTGVLNRMALEQRLDEARSRRSRRAETLSVIALDLDGFKAVNDRHGHDAGDEVLRAVAAALADAIRTDDVLYRLGGDEFLVVAPGTPTSDAVELGERLRATVDALHPGGHPITLSVGVAGAVHAQVDLEHLISKADRALYAAKEAGRNRTASAEPALSPA